MNEDSDRDFVSNAFSTLSPVEPSAALRRKVATIPLEHARNEAWSFWPFKHLWQPSLGLACAGLLGFFSGGYLPGAIPNEEPLLSQHELSVAVQPISDSDELGDDLDGLLALATASDLAWSLEADEDDATTLESQTP